MLSETLDKQEVTSAYIKTPDGYISFGATYFNQDYPNYFRNVELARYDENFNLTKSVRHGDSIHFYYGYYAMTKVQNCYYAIGAKFDGVDTTRGIVIKFDDSLNVIWEKTYLANNKWCSIMQIINKNDTLYLAGHYYSPPNNTNTFIMSCDTAGNIIWQKNFGVSNVKESYLYFSPTSDNGFILTTKRHQSGWNYRTRVYKLDSLGNTQWTKLLGGTGESWVLSCVELPNGNYFCGGGRPHPQHGDYTSYQWINILSPTGNVLRDTSYYFCDYFPACQNFFNFWATPQIDNNSVKVLAYASQNGATIYYTKMDFMGNIIWKRPYNRRQADAIIGTQIPLGNGFTFLGGFAFADDTTNTADNWYIIVDDDGCDTLNCTLSIPWLESETLAVSIYPNPTTGVIHIDFAESTKYDVQCKVYDITGKETYNKPIINKQLTINLEHLPNGIYFLQLSNGDDINISKKIIVQK